MEQLSINVRMIELVVISGTSAWKSAEISHSRKPKNKIYQMIYELRERYRIEFLIITRKQNRRCEAAIVFMEQCDCFREWQVLRIKHFLQKVLSDALL